MHQMFDGSGDFSDVIPGSVDPLQKVQFLEDVKSKVQRWAGHLDVTNQVLNIEVNTHEGAHDIHNRVVMHYVPA